ncbi:MAG TPA: BamA/TamA family outer membrane protein [Gemmatimonadales bacterium]
MTRAGAILLTFSQLLGAGSAVAQDSLLAIRPDAQVGSVEFRFSGSRSFSQAELGTRIALRGRGSIYDLRRALGKLPLVPSPGRYTFDPVELQKDVVRLRQFYRRAGFAQPLVDYEVRTNRPGTVVDVSYVIEEGPAAVLRTFQVVGPDGTASMDVSDSLSASWDAFEARLAARRGQRFGEADLTAAQDSLIGWLHDHGYPFADVRSTRLVDTAQQAVDVRLEAHPGPPTRIGTITVEGNSSVGDQVVLRELPFRTGDLYSARTLASARARLQAVDLLARAVVDVDSQPAADSTLAVRIQVQETRPRLTLAEVGYVSEGAGLTGRVQWTNPNFTGGARSLTTSLEAQSGAGAVGTEAEQLLRASVSLTQPYVFIPRLSFIVGPYAEYRNDLKDQSVAIGMNAALVHRLAALSSIALEYRFSRRHIYEYHFGAVSSGDINLAELLALQYPSLVDSLGYDENKSTLALSGSFAAVDNLTDPRRGWIVRPSAKITFPEAWTTAQFGRLDLSVSRFQPLGPNVVLAARLSAGRLLPFGKSVPSEGSDPIFSFIHLRDESMTAGGTNDVRGWGDRKLGPKVPDVEAHIVGADTVLTADQYVPIGALARVSGSLELRFPTPGMTPAWRTQVFLDAGRVWTPDERFSQTALLPENSELRWSAGVGLSYQTPVGAIGLSLGYKLNPSPLDLRSADKVLDAFEAGQPIESVETDALSRLHLHFSFGVAL